MRFLTERDRDQMLFPRPADGSAVDISPPGLAWLPAKGAGGYRVEIRDANGALVYQKDVGTEPIHLPDRVLGPGEYRWDVVAKDQYRRDKARRGEMSFTVAPGAPELPWVDPEVLLARVPEGHPRLIYPRRELEGIRNTLNTTRSRSWRACLRAADGALDMPAPVYPTYHEAVDPKVCRLAYKDYFGDFRRYINSALMDLSLAYVMTDELRYAEAAKRILMEITEWPTDDDDVTSVSAKWGDEPGLSFSRCAHRAYDWLHGALTDDERSRVLKMCEERAWQTYRRLERRNYLACPGESHNGRLIAYLSEMAIVMAGESDGAKTWLDYSLKGLTTFYPHWGGHEGGWAEGVGYGLAYNQIYLPAFEALRIACDFDLWKRPFFRKVRYFFFYCTALRGEIKPFGDGAERGGVIGRGGGGFPTLLAHHARLFNDPYVGWWADQVEGWSGGGGELSLVFGDELPVKPPADLPGSRAFRGVGWAALHGDLARPDEDTFLLFKSSPYGSVSHSHADQNAFAVMKGGKALAIPSGYYGPSYGQPHHAEWTRSTKANNCVLVNGEGQVIREGKASGRITAFEERPRISYVVGDAAAAYMGKLPRFDRHILFLRPGLFLVLDDLEATAPSRFQWKLHAFEEMEIDDSRAVSRRDGAVLDVHLSSEVGLGLSQTDRFDTPFNHDIPEQFHKDMPNHWHVTAGTLESAQATRIGAIMAVSGPEDPLEISVLDHEGWFGARADGASGSAEGWVQLAAGAPGPEGYDEAVSAGKAKVCGKGDDGDIFAV